MPEELRALRNQEVTERHSFSDLPEHLGRMGRNWGWVLVAGVAYIVIGIFAFNWPISSTIGLTFALGVLFVVTGIVQGIHSIQFRKEAGIGWRIFQTVAALAAGILMLRFPGAGMLGVAIAMTFYFFVSAAAKGVLSMGMYPHKGWGWALTSAVASFLLGFYIMSTFPISALWVPGVILGIDLVVMGISLIGFSFSLKKVHQRISQEFKSTESKRAA